jgi:hypothetical protein
MQSIRLHQKENGSAMLKEKVEKPTGTETLQSATEKLLAEFLTQREAAAELDVCERTLDRWRRLGEGPPITKIGRRVYYRRPTLLAWLCTREQQGAQ